MAVDYSDLYEMSDPFATRPLRLDPAQDPRWGRDDFDKFTSQLIRGQAKAEPPLKLVRFSGGQPADVMWSAYHRILVVSRRVVDLLTMHQFTGWSTYAVEVWDRQRQPLPGYSGLAVTGPRMNRDRSRSEVVTRVAVPGGKPYQAYKGLYFDENQWDGSDFFSCFGIDVTGRVMRALKRAKVTNLVFTRFTEMELDVSLDKPLGRPLDPAWRAAIEQATEDIRQQEGRKLLRSALRDIKRQKESRS